MYVDQIEEQRPLISGKGRERETLKIMAADVYYMLAAKRAKLQRKEREQF